MADDGWKPIKTFDINNQAGRSYLGWFPKCRCVFDMVWIPHNSDLVVVGEFRPFGGFGRFGEQPKYWREMPAPPKRARRHA